MLAEEIYFNVQPRDHFSDSECQVISLVLGQQFSTGCIRDILCSKSNADANVKVKVLPSQMNIFPAFFVLSFDKIQEKQNRIAVSEKTSTVPKRQGQSRGSENRISWVISFNHLASLIQRNTFVNCFINCTLGQAAFEQPHIDEKKLFDYSYTSSNIFDKFLETSYNVLSKKPQQIQIILAPENPENHNAYNKFIVMKIKEECFLSSHSLPSCAIKTVTYVEQAGFPTKIYSFHNSEFQSYIPKFGGKIKFTSGSKSSKMKLAGEDCKFR
ncbi:hypothetical protein WN51_02131 [Melipona quadrifasciata]|uniref:Uncharacterized protein n=1 Tax=Melipona quadrifasciata TaxID=166423 RepID=A0A0M8ZTM6_9HYME|nr:hypothetical protein WN51_02131 [Melipona quadrifasciata]